MADKYKKHTNIGADRSIGRASTTFATQPSTNLGTFFSLARQRVRCANLSVIKNGQYERPGDSRVDEEVPDAKVNMPELWNVENMIMTGAGIEFFHYSWRYERDDSKPGPGEPQENEYSWRLAFKREHFKDIYARETETMKGDYVNVLIEMLFSYDGSPEGNNATRYMETEEEGERREAKEQAEEMKDDEDGEIVEGKEDGGIEDKN